MQRLAWCGGIAVLAALALAWLARDRSDAGERRVPLAPAAARAPDAGASARSAVPSAEPLAAAAPPRAASARESMVEAWARVPLALLAPAARTGTFVRGRIVDALSREPLAGAAIAWTAHDGGTAAPLVTGVAGADGRFELELTRSARARWWYQMERRREQVERGRRELRLAAARERAAKGQAVAAGEASARALGGRGELAADLTFELELSAIDHCPARVVMRADVLAEGTHDVGTLALDPGIALVGRVLGALGEGLAGVEVHLVGADDLRRIASTTTDVRGAYVLSMPLPGRYHVHARSIGRGAVVLQDLTLPPMGDPVLPDVFLRGDAHVRGYVRTPDGEPAEAVVVTAVPAAFEDAPLESIPQEELVYQEMRGGLWGTRAVSDASGEFDLSYLVEGEYVVRIRSEEFEALRPVHAPASGVTMRFEQHRLRVRVDVPDHELAQLGYGGTAPFGRYVLECVEMREDESGELAVGCVGQPLVLHGPGEWLFPIDPFAEHRAVARVGGVAHESEIAIGRYDDWERELTLTLPLEAFVEAREREMDRERAREDDAPRRSAREATTLSVLVPLPSSDAPLPEIEAALDRVLEDGVTEPVTVRWRSGSSDPAAAWEVAVELAPDDRAPTALAVGETATLAPGEYRLRLRSGDRVYYDSPARIVPGGAWVQAPPPQARGASER